MTRTAICLAEDRVSEEAAVRVCIASTRSHNPELPILAFLPNASPALLGWLNTQPLVELRPKLVQRAFGWNVKPHALLAALDSGFDTVWWIDSDVLVRRSLSRTYGGVSTDVLMVTEEARSAAYEDRGLRARGWGFQVSRDFRFTLNSGVIRASQSHRPLLEKWKNLLGAPEYVAAQSLDWRVCPPHLLGDQDILTPLFCGSEFAGVPVRVLRRGPDVVQYYGLACYTLRERLGNAFNGGPTFIHSQGFKPWRSATADGGIPSWKRAYRRLLSDTSVYSTEAQKLRTAVDDDLVWTNAQSIPGRTLRLLGFGHRVVTGLPLAVVGDIVRMLRWLESRFPFQN